MLHDLKSNPENFKQLVSQKRKFDVRLNDRNFVIGDLVTFREFNPKLGKYTGADALTVKVTDLIHGDGTIISNRFVVLSIEPIQ